MKNKQKKDKRIYIRVTQEEYEKVKNKADKSGMTMSQFLLYSADNIRIFPREELKELSGQVFKLGGNINQIARHLNTGNILHAEDIKQDFKEVMHLCQYLKQQLGRLI